jgi:hypothetical protein
MPGRHIFDESSPFRSPPRRLSGTFTSDAFGERAVVGLSDYPDPVCSATERKRNMSKYLAAAALLLAAGAASADLSFSLVPVDNTNGDAEDPLFSTTWDTYDMVVTVTGDDDWTAAEALITVDAPATIFQHPFENADQSPPNPAFFGAFPSLEFDSYFSAPGGIGFASAAVVTPTSMEAAWFDTVDSGDGDFVLARKQYKEMYDESDQRPGGFLGEIAEELRLDQEKWSYQGPRVQLHRMVDLDQVVPSGSAARPTSPPTASIATSTPAATRPPSSGKATSPAKTSQAHLQATARRGLQVRQRPQGHGVKKGDRVCIYLQMIPELAVAMLACARIGAIHSIVFGGFSADSCADRIVRTRPARSSSHRRRPPRQEAHEPEDQRRQGHRAADKCPDMGGREGRSSSSAPATTRCPWDGRDIWWHD